MILSIQYFRGVAALMVLFAHLAGHINNVYAQKDLGYILFGQFYSGVDLFFIISGFVICLSTEKIERQKSLKYIIKRVLRVYPLLVFCIVTYAIYLNFFGAGVSSISVLKAMIPVHADYNLRPPYFGYNLLPTAWTLSFELLFYFIFLISMCISKSYRILITLSLLFIVFSALQIFYSGKISFSAFTALDFPDNYGRPLLAILSSPMMLDFCIGMLSFVIYKKITLPNNDVVKTALVFVFILTLIILCSGILQPLAYEDRTKLALHGPAKWGMLFFFMFNAVIMYEKTFGIKKRQVLILMGEVSYSIYLTQWVVFGYMLSIPFVKNMQGFSKFTLLGVVVFFVSLLTYRYIEKPFLVLSKKIIKRMS